MSLHQPGLWQAYAVDCEARSFETQASKLHPADLGLQMPIFCHCIGPRSECGGYPVAEHPCAGTGGSKRSCGPLGSPGANQSNSIAGLFSRRTVLGAGQRTAFFLIDQISTVLYFCTPTARPLYCCARSDGSEDPWARVKSTRSRSIQKSSSHLPTINQQSLQYTLTRFLVHLQTKVAVEADISPPDLLPISSTPNSESTSNSTSCKLKSRSA